jgi:hypothetical protein
MYGIFAQKDGNVIAAPTRIITNPEKPVQKLGGILMKSVVALRSNVNTITERESEPITVSARLETPRDPTSDAPITTGSSGNMHGARTVNTPAKTAIAKKIILLDFC